MKLYELDHDDPNEIKLVGIITQIYNRIKDTGFTKKYNLTSLLNTLSDAGIHIDEFDFRDMINDHPLNNLIADIKGDSVIFKGDSDTSTDVEKPHKSTSTLEKMAKKASKK